MAASPAFLSGSHLKCDIEHRRREEGRYSGAPDTCRYRGGRASPADSSSGRAFAAPCGNMTLGSSGLASGPNRLGTACRLELMARTRPAQGKGPAACQWPASRGTVPVLMELGVLGSHHEPAIVSVELGLGSHIWAEARKKDVPPYHRVRGDSGITAVGGLC